MISPVFDPQQRHQRSTPSTLQQLPPSQLTPTQKMIQRARLDPHAMAPHEVLALQRAIGNTGVTEMLQSKSPSKSPGMAPAFQHKFNVGVVDAPDEHAADQVAASEQQPAITQQTTQPTIARQAATIQRWPWNRLKKWRKHNMTDDDVVEHTPGEGGSMNRVDKLRYNRGIGKSKQTTGFFKPNTIIEKGFRGEREDVGMANRAVHSSSLDKWLGLNILSEEVWAQHQGESGSVSAQVAGQPLFENLFETPEAQDFEDDYADPAMNKKINGRWYKQSGQHYNYHDFSNPQTQKGLSDLQLLDAITGQKDRHGGNIYIDQATGKVKGIDNDQAFSEGEREFDIVAGKYLGLPSLVDKRTAKKVLKKKAKNLPKVLRSQHGGSLSDEEIQEAQRRMREVKKYLKQLKKEKKLVNKWDDTTYLKAYSEEDRMDTWGTPMAPSYTKRSIEDYKNAPRKENSQEAPLSFSEVNPLFEEERF